MSEDDRTLHAALATFRDVAPAAHVVDDDEEAPKFSMTGRRTALFVLFVLAALAFLYFVLPQLGDVKDTWGRLNEGEPGWLAVAAAMQVASMVCYMVVFQDIHVPPGFPIKLKETYQITMASLAATRLFAAGGAGGVALTAWALRRAGLPRKDVATRMIAFLVLTYAVYMLALIICGFGLRWGVFPGNAPFALTIVPAYIAIVAFLIFFAIAFLPADLERRITGYQAGGSRASKLLAAAATGPARLGDGVRFAIHSIRHPDLALLGTIGWWGFNIGVLYACFEAFGHAPPIAVIIEAYFVGMLGNLLPLPGGIGGVDAGMYGVFVAFDVPGSLALISVLTYRLFAFWLPSLPGAVAYFQLRRTVARWRTERGSNATVSPGTIQSEVTP
jgi:uncharacterized protein (TIRG00374 family)